MSRHQNAGQNHNIKMANKLFENVAKFKTWEQRYQNWIHYKIKNRLNSGNCCYHAVQNLLSSHTLPKNVMFKIYRTIILAFVSYGCYIWPLTLIKDHRFGILENRILRRIFGPKRMIMTGDRENYIMRCFIIYIHHQILLHTIKVTGRKSTFVSVLNKTSRHEEEQRWRYSSTYS
jgi:hypothetical protein